MMALLFSRLHILFYSVSKFLIFVKKSKFSKEKQNEQSVKLNQSLASMILSLVAHFPDNHILSTINPATCKIYTGHHATSNIGFVPLT